MRRVRNRVVRLLAAWAGLVAVLVVLRGVLTDPFWRGILLPIVLVVVIVAGVLTVRWSRVGERSGQRRTKERRLRDRRGE